MIEEMEETKAKKIGTNLETILAKWKFPRSVIEKYKSKGIDEIFEWQAECLNTSQVSNGENLVYSAPTSAGKTLVAELLMLKNILATKRKAILILPFVSLAREKLKYLQWLLSDSYLKADGFIGSSSPYGGISCLDIAVCTIEKSNSLLNKLIDEERVFDIGIIVVDELHMINDGSRGSMLELILSKIKYLCEKNKDKNKIQIVGMSATLPNLKVIAEWLNASLYETDYRPISLMECIKYEKSIYNKEMSVVNTINVDGRIENDAEHVVHLVLETIVNKFGVLVFCPTKSRCETLAENIARSIYNLEKNHGVNLSFLNKEKIMDCLSELKNTPAGLDTQLAKTVRYGISFHHAGLTVEEREILENYFKQGDLLVIVCTSTLSSGINFPARRVIIRTPMFNGKPVDVMSYKQMVGRAGRKGIDTLGESILMCANPAEKRLGECLLNSKLPEINFSNNNDTDLLPAIKRALLETIVSGIAAKKSEIVAYSNCFLKIKSQQDKNICDKYLKWLNLNQFIDIVNTEENGECYKPTQLGYAVVASAMSPDEGLIIFSELQKAMQCFVLENELHIIYQITPMNICDYWTSSASNIDWNLYYTMLQNFGADVKRVCDLVGVRQSFILKMIKGSSNFDPKLLRVHLRFYTALILNDLVNEVSFSCILNKYNCQKGFLQSLQQSSATYAHMIHLFCNRLGWFNLEILVEQFQSRLAFGVQRQLLDLVRIDLLNSHRARLFYSAGLTTVASVAMADLKKIEKILRSGVQFNIKRQGEFEGNQNNGCDVAIWHDGKGFSYWEAASVILKKSSELLKMDLELLGVKVDLNYQKKESQADKFLFEFNDTCNNTTMQQSTLNKTKIDLDVNEEDQVVGENEPKETLLDTVELLIVKTPEKKIFNSIENSQATINKKIELNDEKLDKYSLQYEINSLQGLILESQVEAEVNKPKPSINKSPIVKENKESFFVEKSFLDDQCILEAAEKFESRNKKKIDCTIVSEDILEMCEIFEKNVLSSKKKAKPRQKENLLNKSLAKNLFGDETLRNLMENSVLDPIQHSLNKNEILNNLEKLNLNLKINLIESKNEYEEFFMKLKPKSTVSLGFACDFYPKDVFDSNCVFFTDFHTELNMIVKFYGVSISVDVDRQKEINFFLFKKDRLFVEYLKRLLVHRDDLVKVLFFTKEHCKLVYDLFKIQLKNGVYDPILGNWLINQENFTIYQIKQKYCPSLSVGLDSNLRAAKACYGCCMNETLRDSSVETMQKALAEALISIYSFEKIRLQLQLENLWIYFAKVESEIVLISARVEMVGLGLSLTEMERQKELLVKFRREIEERVNAIAGRQVNLNSSAEVASVVYDELKLKPNLDSCAALLKFKHHSTSKGALEQLGKQHLLPRLIILWRKITHSITNSLYPVERAKRLDRSLDMYRVHSKIDLFTVTGRMCFNDPCLQHVPKDFDLNIENLSEFDLSQNSNGFLTKLNREEFLDDSSSTVFFLEKLDDENKLSTNVNSLNKNCVSLRSLFIPCENRVFLSADYCQLELRIIANLCKDETLTSIFNDTKHDVFNLLASKWLNLPLNEIDEEKRQNVKKVIYGIIYGISPKTLGAFLNLNENEASCLIDSFKSTFPGLKKFISNQIELCRTKGYVETIRKRRRCLPNISSLDAKLRAQAERQAINTIVQGSASDLVKSAMVKIEKLLRKKFHSARNEDLLKRGTFLVMQLHDELIYEVNENDLNDVKSIVRDCMENCIEFVVKMKVKMRVGSSWGTLTKIE